MKKTLVLILFMVLTFAQDAWSQCAMCRATVENNVANGEIGIGAGLNTGILYLFVLPYLGVAVLGYLWYKKSKENASKYKRRRYPAG
jgi:hypothetical protein